MELYWQSQYTLSVLFCITAHQGGSAATAGWQTISTVSTAQAASIRNMIDLRGKSRPYNTEWDGRIPMQLTAVHFSLEIA
jgi:hypothetical protein